MRSPSPSISYTLHPPALYEEKKSAMIRQLVFRIRSFPVRLGDVGGSAGNEKPPPTGVTRPLDDALQVATPRPPSDSLVPVSAPKDL